MLFNLIHNIHKEGYIFIMISFLASCIGFAISCSLGIVCLAMSLLCIFFFRDPIRVVPEGDNLITSPADGLILDIKEVNSPIDSSTQVVCISIFLNILNVHVNRIPVSGTIKSTEYIPGRFISASLDKSSELNERQRLIIESNLDKHLIILDQIAGLIARRIVCNAYQGQNVNLGEKFGIIRFGSRVNIYLPLSTHISVFKGQTVIAGETILAYLKEAPKQLTVKSI
ncbi:phosphatidylserine decarboxylase [Ehrlichia canis]|uniref:Phosphatidylserine decarboxylase proenzyme n=1 Tax=Ehrlichia canis (strain Jake) TaxID=269484 RepID=PSD_EHRCJ|nr:phosphatidylserine decarboxylase [Ehrlichia canis]Q3YSG2.1 RecName: Full=Phosphatidylserine decarboxylase proenzyme; Contains: RecName: Full=Phosphatidylserine decarboxylase alpha chain; Contains: RecName: Full=Phosphatidylserine decarboxylase beta chain [Ehrlichia canis str. Jake]AAZ68343.1 Phosphatidylserine decarboxylase-related protein [Ehrlichia canis str. Jake]AUO54898.1 phosphatidylserine decarboxylase proenzyme [Ehrlichia canis]UKC53513.1 phosphatidylserine decarboxylase [Ehrlichia c